MKEVAYHWNLILANHDKTLSYLNFFRIVVASAVFDLLIV